MYGSSIRVFWIVKLYALLDFVPKLAHAYYGDLKSCQMVKFDHAPCLSSVARSQRPNS